MNELCKKIRSEILAVSHKSGHGHIPTSFSIVEMLCAVYQTMRLDLKIERLEQVYQTGDRAMIRPVNGAIHVLITRTTSAGIRNLYEETVPLEKIIGNNGAVPVLRIGRSWYLTEG